MTDTHPIKEIFSKKITTPDGTKMTLRVEIYEQRPASSKVYRAKSPFSSLNDGKIIELGQWCEYRLRDVWRNWRVWDSFECDNGIESQRHDFLGAKNAAQNTINELESGLITKEELFGD